MTFATAISYIDSYVNGSITYLDSNLLTAYDVVATGGHYTSIAKWNLTVNGKSSDRLDTNILASCNYWYNKFSSLGYQFNPSYVKAMIGVESRMGTYEGSRHGTTDVMQCLDKDNPSVYCMAKIAPTNGVAYSAAEGLSYGMKSGGYQAVRAAFTGSTPDYTKYNSRLSILFGVLWLGYKTAVKGSIQNGTIAYNGGGNPNYWNDVMSCYQNPASYLGS